jgi:hypothetical protein
MTEQWKYRVLKNLGSSRIELREYEPCVFADVVVQGDQNQAGNLGFRPLVNYISRNNIAMTAPVVLDAAAPAAWRVSFVMPSGMTLSDLPAPQGQTVTLREVPMHQAAAIRFSGTTSSRSVEMHEAELRTAIAAAGMKAVGEPQIARFDPPWKPGFLRHNEVVLAVE